MDWIYSSALSFWVLHFDLHYEEDGVVHKEPIRGIVKGGQTHEVRPSRTPTWGLELRIPRTLPLATLFWVELANHGQGVVGSHFVVT